MEFTRLADVDVVETANDTDKVLIEQNGEIKRVPKTEVGGAGGSTLIVDASLDMETEAIIATANMTLTEVIEAFDKHELAGGVLYFAQPEGVMCVQMVVANATATVGFKCVVLMCEMIDTQLFWTEAGISTEPPM